MNTEFVPVQAGKSSEILTVGQLNRAVASLLERSFPLAWVRGEISNFTRAASGHWYFSLKDAQAQIRCVMFRGRNQLTGWQPREGEQVEVRALLSMYEARGEVQLNVEAMRRAGQGGLFEAFLRLKEKLAAEGLFDAERKRPLPAHPRAIGVVTSLQAAALRDVLTTLARRAPHVPVVVYPAPVQGQGAAEKLAMQLQLANQRAEVDVIVLCRGGGSIEDLWAFNEEVLARTIVASRLPVVVGVGHETDFTMADFVADVRAPTPTAAAELASPNRAQLLANVEAAHFTLQNRWQRLLERQAQRLDGLSRRLQSPQARLRTQQAELAQAALRLQHALRTPLWQAQQALREVEWRWQQQKPDTAGLRSQLGQRWAHCQRVQQQQLVRQQQRVAQATDTLNVLSPQRTLERGYAVLLRPTAQGAQAIRKPQQLSAGQTLTVRVAEGQAQVTLAEVQADLGLG